MLPNCQAAVTLDPATSRLDVEDLRERKDTPVRSALPAKLLCQLLHAHGMHAVATAVATAQQRRPCDLVTLTSMTPSKLGAYLGKEGLRGIEGGVDGDL